MIWLSLTILAPLGAGLTTLALRRMPEAIALTGAAFGLAGAIALFAKFTADNGKIRKQTGIGRGDVGVIMIRRLWARELQAMANGKPLKNWTRTPDIVPEVWGLRGTPAIGPTNGGDTDDAPTAALVDVRPYIEINSLLELLGGRPG